MSLILVFQLQDIVSIQNNLNKKIVIDLLAKVLSVLVHWSYSVSKNQIGANLPSQYIAATMKGTNPKYQNCVIAEYL